MKLLERMKNTTIPLHKPLTPKHEKSHEDESTLAKNPPLIK